MAAKPIGLVTPLCGVTPVPSALRYECRLWRHQLTRQSHCRRGAPHTGVTPLERCHEVKNDLNPVQDAPAEQACDSRSRPFPLFKTRALGKGRRDPCGETGPGDLGHRSHENIGRRYDGRPVASVFIGFAVHDAGLGVLHVLREFTQDHCESYRKAGDDDLHNARNAEMVTVHDLLLSEIAVKEGHGLLPPTADRGVVALLA